MELYIQQQFCSKLQKKRTLTEFGRRVKEQKKPKILSTEEGGMLQLATFVEKVLDKCKLKSISKYVRVVQH
jgi:hypothetical protein